MKYSGSIAMCIIKYYGAASFCKRHAISTILGDFIFARVEALNATCMSFVWHVHFGQIIKIGLISIAELSVSWREIWCNNILVTICRKLQAATKHSYTKHRTTNQQQTKNTFTIWIAGFGWLNNGCWTCYECALSLLFSTK